MSEPQSPRRHRPRTDSDTQHVFTYFYTGPHEFDSFPPARWPEGVLEKIPEDESESERHSRERRERYRACIVMSGRRLDDADVDKHGVDHHIESCIATGLEHPFQWARHRPNSV